MNSVFNALFLFFLLFTFSAAQDEVAVILSQFDGMNDVYEEGQSRNLGAETCRWDSVNSIWWINVPDEFSEDGISQLSTWDGQETITAVTPAPLAQFGNLNTGIEFVPSQDGLSDTNYLYIANAQGTLSKYNVDDMEFEGESLALPDAIVATAPCYDAENDVLYVTDSGFNFDAAFNPTPVDPATNTFPGIYRIEDISTTDFELDDLTITKILTPTTLPETRDEWAAITGELRVYHPDKCVIRDGILYIVEFRDDNIGGLGMYNIDTEEWSVNTDVLNVSADGIAFSDNYLIVIANIDQNLMYYDLDNFPEGTFEENVALSGLPSAGFSINEDGVICNPTYLGPSSGLLSTVQWTNPDEIVTPSPTLTGSDAAEVLSRFDGANEGLDVPRNLGAETCRWDSVNNIWWVNIPDESSEAGIGQLSTWDGENTLTAVTPSPGGLLNTGIEFVPAQDGRSDTNYLYIANAAGTLQRYNVDDREFEGEALALPDAIVATAPCYDAETDTLFVTDSGFSFDAAFNPTPIDPETNGGRVPGIYRIEDISTTDFNLEDLDITKILTPTSVPETRDSWAAITGETRVYHPDKCVIRDGTVYFTEYRDDNIGGLGIYDIESDEFSVNFDVLNVSADGIAFSDNYLIIIANIDMELLYYDLDNFPEGTFEENVALSGLPSAGFSINEDGVICNPTYLGPLSGTLWTVQWTNPAEPFIPEDPENPENPEPTTRAPSTSSTSPPPTTPASSSLFLILSSIFDPETAAAIVSGELSDEEIAELVDENTEEILAAVLGGELSLSEINEVFEALNTNLLALLQEEVNNGGGQVGDAEDVSASQSDSASSSD